MRPDLLALAASLTRAGETFALAIVVRREPASSVQVGNMAVITRAGTCHGWLGGSCIQPTVVREALAALEDETPRLISLTPDAEASRRAGMAVYPMTCHSGGSVEVYVEPMLPPPRLLIFGLSPAAQALSRLGKAMGYAVEAIDPDATSETFPEADRVSRTLAADALNRQEAFSTPRLFAAVATLGQRDEEATWEALALRPAYLGVVASRKRFAQIRDTLVARGASSDALDAVRNPAGLDIGAKTPEEIALSILAEIVQVRRTTRDATKVPESAHAMDEARDPVCGMTVRVSTAKHRADHLGRVYYFCCGGCRDRFLASPERYEESVRA